jgi:pentalenolactone synthase
MAEPRITRITTSNGDPAWEALWRNPALASSAVEEILRAPFPGPDTASWQAGRTPRYADTDIQLGDVTISAGDLVLLGRPAANQDERVFPEPRRFDLDRRGAPHLAFGHGPSFCLGAPLARVELQAVFETIPRRLPTLCLAVPVEDLRRRTDLLFGKAHRAARHVVNGSPPPTAAPRPKPTTAAPSPATTLPITLAAA